MDRRGPVLFPAMSGDRNVTAIAEARWRKRNAVQGVKDALVELRVANRELAKAEGRPVPVILAHPSVSRGRPRGGKSSLPPEELAPGAATVPGASFGSDAVLPPWQHVGEGSGHECRPGSVIPDMVDDCGRLRPPICANCRQGVADFFTPGGNGICSPCYARWRAAPIANSNTTTGPAR